MAIAAAVALFATGAAADAGARSATISLGVLPALSLFDSPTSIVVKGLETNQPVTVTVTSMDAAGVTWTSSANYNAGSGGTNSESGAELDLRKAAAQKGSYSGYCSGLNSCGVDAMGQFDLMRPDKPPKHGVYSWDRAKPRQFTVTASVKNGPTLTQSVQRVAQLPGEAMHIESVSADGFYGRFFQPSATATAKPGCTVAKCPAVLMFGGSEGGLHPALLLGAGLLAAHGYPTLALAYFGNAEGLHRPRLSAIPLEYFEKALRWLAKQPGVDREKIFVSGTSRGSEAALLLGVKYQPLVYGVIANVPSNVVHCAPSNLPSRVCLGPPWTLEDSAWTFGDKALTYTRMPDNASPTDKPDAVIPVEQIRGPLFLDCGKSRVLSDGIWSSCPYTQAIVDRLRSHGNTNPPVVLIYPDGGHGLGLLVPYLPRVVQNPNLLGTTPFANGLDDANLWPQLLAFLQR